MTSGDFIDPEIAEMSPVINVETWLEDDDHSIAFVSVNGVNRIVMNRGSDITYHVISGTGTMNFPEEARAVALFPNARITIPKGTVYHDAGNLVMLATATPPFDPEMEEVIK